MSATVRIKPGDRVILPGPFGLIGKVLEVYGPKGISTPKC